MSLVVNPAAGSGAAASVAALAATLLREAGYGVRQVLGRNPAEAVELTRSSVRRDTVAVLAVGGDGTVQQAVQAVAGTDTPLGIVPTGTGNDLVDVLRLPAAPLAAVAAVIDSLRDGSVRRIDLGRVGARWWTTVLCAGFDSMVSERVRSMTRVRGPRRYDLAVVLEAARLRPIPLRVTLDDEAPIELDATLVAVGNTSQYGAGMSICPDADPADGRFDVTVVAALSRARLLRLAPLLRTGGHVDRPEVTRHRAARVRLELLSTATRPLRAYADGEPLAELPIDVACVPAAVGILAR